MANKEILENVLIDDIKPYERNPRKNDSAVKSVAKSIERLGYRTPIIIDENNVILCGHTRHKAIKSLNWTHIPFIVKFTDLTKEQKDEYRILDNKTSEIAEWDFEILTQDFTTEELLDFGFDVKDLPQEEVIEDEAPPVPETPRTIKGDIYQLGNHRVMCGDSTIITDVEKLMNGKKADIVFTDPPYGVDYKGINNDSRSGLEKLLSDSFSNYYAVSKSGASIYCFHSDRCADVFHKIFREYFHFSSMIIWEKNSITLSQTDYQSKHEPCLYGWMKDGTHSWHADRKESSVWHFDKERVVGHTTPKPIMLIVKAISNSSKSEDLVLDLFLGSGSTLIACEQTNRICYGMELDEKYCDVIVQRWVNLTGGKVICNGKDIEWPKTENNNG